MSGPSPRYAQLIYTSFDDGSGAGGGWQVKDATGGPTPAERHELTARIVTRFDVGEPLPTYPTPSQIADRPARLMYSRLDGDAAGYWHTVEAGRDATGRPGNVFAHVVLDRRISEPSPLRPIQLWKSAHWLRPYNAAEVAACTLAGDGIPEPSEHVTAEAVITFLAGTTVDRQSAFRVLLDAVYAAMAGGPGVLLITGDIDSGPRWIAAISYFMSPGTARRFSWSTHDDPALAAADLGRGIHLVVVLRDRAAEVPAGQWITIDENEEPSIGEPGSTHRTRAGEIAVTAWSVLAEGVLVDEHSATRLLEQQDTIAAELGDHDLTPVWPLAVAVRQDPGLGEFHTDSDHVIADDAPSEADSVEWIGAAVAASVAATAPKTVAEAYERFSRARRRGAGVAAAAELLLRNILADPEWILDGPLAEVPAEPIVELGPLHAEIAEAQNRLAELCPPDSVQLLRGQLRFAELLARLGCADPSLENETARIGALINPEALHGFADNVASRTLLDDAAIGLPIRERVLRPVLARQPASVLRIVDTAVWQWLYSDHAAAPVIPPDPPSFDGVLLPRFIIRALENPQSCSLTTESMSRLASDGIYLALGADGLSDEDCRELVTKLGLRASLSISDLTDIFGRWPQRMGPGAAIYALLSRAVPEELVARIAGTTLPAAAHRWDHCAVAVARLRSLYCSPRPWASESVERVLAESAPTVLSNMPRGRGADLVIDLLEPLAVLFIVGQTRGQSWCDIECSGASELRQGISGRMPDVVDLLADMVEINVIEADWFVAHAVLERISAELATPTLLTDSAGEPWTDLLVRELTKRGAYQAPTDAAAVRDTAWTVVRGLSAAHAERFFTGYPDAAREWLEANAVGIEKRQRPVFGWIG